MTATGVVGRFATKVYYATLDVIFAFPFLTPTIIFQLEHHRVGECVIASCNIDIVVLHSSHFENPRANVVACDLSHVAVLKMEVSAGLCASPLDSNDVGRSLLEVLSPLRRSNYHARCVVGLQTTIQQMGNWADYPA